MLSVVAHPNQKYTRKGFWRRQFSIVKLTLKACLVIQELWRWCLADLSPPGLQDEILELALEQCNNIQFLFSMTTIKLFEHD